MTPDTAAEVLYDDILSLRHALAEHRQLSGVLGRVARVLELRDLLREVLEIDNIRAALVNELCSLYRCPELIDALVELPSAALAGPMKTGACT